MSKEIMFIFVQILFIPVYIVKIPLYAAVLLEMFDQKMMSKYNLYEDEAFNNKD